MDVIEFEYMTGPGPNQVAVMVINTDIIATFEPRAGSNEGCAIVLKSGRQIEATANYSDFRRLVLESRSGFATEID